MIIAKTDTEKLKFADARHAARHFVKLFPDIGEQSLLRFFQEKIPSLGDWKLRYSATESAKTDLHL